MLSKQIIRALIAFIIIILVGVIILPETEGFKKKKKYKDPVGHKINRWFRNLVKPRVVKNTNILNRNTETNAVIFAGTFDCPFYDETTRQCVNTCPANTTADSNNICKTNAVTPATTTTTAPATQVP